MWVEPSKDLLGKTFYLNKYFSMAMKCEKCNSEMEEIDRHEVMVELPEDASEGQNAEYTAAQESGDYGEWGET